MKLLGTLLASVTSEREMRQNLMVLARLFVLVLVVVAVFTVGFHMIMLWEGQYHSWFTGVYWTLTVMSTLGFGDITFQTDLGRAFAMVVLLTGMILLLIVLPFAFIRFFYAPWLEAQVRLRAPRQVADSVTEHVILTARDAIADGLIQRFRTRGMPYYLVEPDPTTAAYLQDDGISVITGAFDDSETYARMGADRARLVLAGRDDVANSNIALSVREAAPHVRIAALAENPDSVDILELAGCDDVLALKQQLGQMLARRADTHRGEIHVVGRFRELEVAEFSARNTPLVGKTVGDSGLREMVGVTVVGMWDRAHLVPVSSKTLITERCVPIVVGTSQMIEDLDAYLSRAVEPHAGAVLIIGGGKVGRAATRELKELGAAVHLIERNPERIPQLEGIADRVFLGDANNRELMERAGLDIAPSVLLTTNDDAMNIYLAVYCRRLRPDLLIVSRITHQRNVESIQRAGADLALSYATLGVESTFSLIRDRESVVLGEGVELLEIMTPSSLFGRTLAQSAIGERTGLHVIALQTRSGLIPNPPPDTLLDEGSELAMIGDEDRYETFVKTFGR
jgi:voltage-gated potassium channel